MPLATRFVNVLAKNTKLVVELKEKVRKDFKMNLCEPCVNLCFLCV